MYTRSALEPLTAISLPTSTFLAAILMCLLRLLAARPPFALPSCSGRFSTALSAIPLLFFNPLFSDTCALILFSYTT